MNGVIKRKNIKFIKLCLISPITKIFINILYIISFLVLFILFYSEDQNFNNFEINELVRNYLNYNQFSEIKNSSDFQSYLEYLLNKLYTIDSFNDSIPILIPLGPIRLSQFSYNNYDCINYKKSCNHNFTCVIESLTYLYSSKCDEKNTNINDIKINESEKEIPINNDDENESNILKFIPKLTGFYSNYDIIKEGKFIDLTISNYKNKNYEIQNLIEQKDLKLLLLQMNFKLNSNDNFIDVIIGIEMINYYRNIKMIFNVFPFNNPNKKISLIFQIFFDISVVLEAIRLIYEINVKLIWSVSIFAFINLLVAIIYLSFNIIELYVCKGLILSINLNQFENHLPLISIKKYIKIFNSILFLFIPFNIFSLLSWWKTISEHFIKLIHVYFRMFPGILITFFLFSLNFTFFIFINYILFNDIFPQFQSLYESFIFMFESNKIEILLNSKNSRLFHNLSLSHYAILFVVFEIFVFYIVFIVLVSTLVFLFKKANLLEMPKMENEKEKQIELNESFKDLDLQKLPKQILWINLTSKNYLFKIFSSKYALLLFKNSKQIISFIKYLLAVKPELQFQKLYRKYNIIIELNEEKYMTEKELDTIYYLADWLIFVGCKIPICIYSEVIFTNSIRMKLLKAYKYIFFINNENQLEKFISKNFGKDNCITNCNNFFYISEKKPKVEENDNDDESDSSLLKRKINQSTIKINNRKRTNTNLHFSAQKTLIPYSTLNLKNNN